MPHPEKEAVFTRNHVERENRWRLIEAVATELADALEQDVRFRSVSPEVIVAETRLRTLLGLPKLER